MSRIFIMMFLITTNIQFLLCQEIIIKFPYAGSFWTVGKEESIDWLWKGASEREIQNTDRSEENLPSKQEDKTVAIAQSQSKSKLIFSKPNTGKQYYLTIGDQIGFIPGVRLGGEEYCTFLGEILSMDSDKNTLILSAQKCKDTTIRQWVSEGVRDTTIDQYIRAQTLRTNYTLNGYQDLLVRYTERNVPTFSYKISKKIYGPGYYKQVYESKCRTLTFVLCLDNLAEIEAWVFKRGNSSNFFHKKIKLGKWAVKIDF